jgi:biopolymer transport protein ExbD
LAGVPIADATELSARLRAALENARGRLVYVEADARLPYAAVAQLLTRCRESGAEEVALISAPGPR